MGDQLTAFGPFVLDRERRRLTRNGEPVPVNHRGLILLEALLDAAGEPVSKDVLMERAWPQTAIEEGNLSVQISTLRRQLGDGADAIIVTVPRIGYRLVAQADRAAAESVGPPLVAVLPFGDASGTDAYFADGVVDDIRTALSRFKSFAVVSRGASTALGYRASDMRAAAAELGVRYTVAGSIQHAGDSLRVTAEVVDLSRGIQLWAERYDGTKADVFAFQDHITERVAGIVEPTIRRAEIERARRKPAASLDAYDLFLRAMPLISAPGHTGYPEALSLLARSAELDSGFAMPRAYAAWVHEKRISLRLPSITPADHDTCVRLAHQALQLGGDDPLIRAIASMVLYRTTNDAAAVHGLAQAVEDNPHNVVILNLAGITHLLKGNADEAYRCRARAYALSPGAPDAYQSLHGMGAAELLRGNYDAAIDWCLKSLAVYSDWIFPHYTLTACYVLLGRLDEARATVRRIRDLNPALTLASFRDGIDPCDDAYGDMVIPMLGTAGLPER